MERRTIGKRERIMNWIKGYLATKRQSHNHLHKISKGIHVNRRADNSAKRAQGLVGNKDEQSHKAELRTYKHEKKKSRKEKEDRKPRQAIKQRQHQIHAQTRPREKQEMQLSSDCCRSVLQNCD